MSISRIQSESSKIQKNYYETISKISLDEFSLFDEEHLSFLYGFCDEYLGFEFKIRKDVEMLDGSIEDVKDKPLYSDWLGLSFENVENHLKNISHSSLDLLRGAFNPFEYQKESLAILDLLSDKGITYFYIPSGIYSTLVKDLKKHKFYVNAIFGGYDYRDSNDETDQKNIIPIYCKYIALYISRVKTKHLFIWSELNILSSGTGDYDKHTKSFNQVLSNKSKLTKKSVVYQKMITGDEPIIYSSNKFLSLEGFYYTVEKDSLKNLSQKKSSEVSLSELVGGCYTGSYVAATLLECYKTNDDSYWIDADLIKSKFEELNKIPDSMEDLSDEIKALDRSLNRAMKGTSYKKNEALNHVDKILIIETVQAEHIPPFIEIYHPKDWLWGEYKNWQEQSEEREVALLEFSDPISIIQLDFLLHYLRSEEGLIQIKLALCNTKKIFEAWKDIKIPLSSIEDQKTIVSALNSSKSIKTRVNSLEKNLIQNPLNISETEQELKEMVSRLEMLSESDQIAQWISRRGSETDQIEFKQTLMLDIKTQTSEKRLETTSFKTIVGFINNNGGNLVIGVSDSGEVTGMEHELEKFHKNSHDKFKIIFGTKISKRIGKEFLSNISYEFIPLHGKYVFRVKCTKSKNECFLDGVDYYVRRHAYTEKLDGPELIKYCKEHYDPEKWDEES